MGGCLSCLAPPPLSPSAAAPEPAQARIPSAPLSPTLSPPSATSPLLSYLVNDLRNQLLVLTYVSRLEAPSVADIRDATSSCHAAVERSLELLVLLLGASAPAVALSLRRQAHEALARLTDATRVRLNISPAVPAVFVARGEVLQQMLVTLAAYTLQHAHGGGPAHISISLLDAEGEVAFLAAKAVQVPGDAVAMAEMAALRRQGRATLRLLLEVSGSGSPMSTSQGGNGEEGTQAEQSKTARLMGALVEQGQLAVGGLRVRSLSVALLIVRHLLALLGGGSILVKSASSGGGQGVCIALTCAVSSATQEQAAELQEEGLSPNGGVEIREASSGSLLLRSSASPTRGGLLAVVPAAPETGRSGPPASESSLLLSAPPAQSSGCSDAGFHTAVPLVSAETQAGGPPEALPALGLHILVADDSRLATHQVEHFLQQLRCTCVVVDDGDQVRHELSATTRPFDAILLDIFMRRSDGAVICKRLRSEDKARCPIIAMTAATSREELERYAAMGFDCVLSKPFNCQRLARALKMARAMRGGAYFSRLPAAGGDTAATSASAGGGPEGAQSRDGDGEAAADSRAAG